MDHAIVEVKETLTGERKEFTCKLVAHAARQAIVLYRIPSAVRVDELALPAGTVTFGYFWEGRPYNAYHWLSPEGETFGVYFNISDNTRITPSEITWRDLVVDVLAYPDGRCAVLDEEELPPDLRRSLREKIEAVRDELVRRHGEIRADVEAGSAKLMHMV